MPSAGLRNRLRRRMALPATLCFILAALLFLGGCALHSRERDQGALAGVTAGNLRLGAAQSPASGSHVADEWPGTSKAGNTSRAPQPPRQPLQPAFSRTPTTSSGTAPGHGRYVINRMKRVASPGSRKNAQKNGEAPRSAAPEFRLPAQ